jgi:hypothetical protein
MFLRDKKAIILIFGRIKKTVPEARAATIILRHGHIITRSVRNDAREVYHRSVHITDGKTCHRISLGHAGLCE